MRAAGRAVVAAYSFLTVLPVGRRLALDAKDVARGSALFPVVGATIGALTGGAAWFLGDHLPSMLAAVLAVALGVAVTGALHLDGLADCADGLGARTPEDRLRVMRDHTNGTYGGAALLLDLLVRTAVLSALAGLEIALWISIAAGAWSRTSGPVLSAFLPYAQSRPGAGGVLNEERRRGTVILSVLVAGTIVAGSYAADAYGGGGELTAAGLIASIGATAAVIWIVGRTARRRLGGVTGDVMGACSELVELAVLVALIAAL